MRVPGPAGKTSNLANMASAITSLYSLGYTLADDELGHPDMMDEDRGSDKSSPDTHRQRQMNAFDPAHQYYSMGSALLPTQMQPASQYAAVLAGIGLNLTAVRRSSVLNLPVEDCANPSDRACRGCPCRDCPWMPAPLPFAILGAHMLVCWRCRRTLSATNFDCWGRMSC